MAARNQFGFRETNYQLWGRLEIRAMQGENGQKEMPLWTIVVLAIVIGSAIAEVILHFFNR